MHHHAQLFIGHHESAIPHARAYASTLLSAEGLRFDVWELETERLGVEEVKYLQARAWQAPTGPQQVLLLIFRVASVEAQNALLKLVEEPPERTTLLFVVPTETILIPTLLSRMSISRVSHQERTATNTFMGLTIPKRITHIEKLLKSDDAHQKAHDMLDAIEHDLYHALQNGDTNAAEKLRHALLVRTYLDDRSASKKVLLEYLAHTL